LHDARREHFGTPIARSCPLTTSLRRHFL
jgi:hypothetical protein